MLMNQMLFMNMSAMMAEDSGAPELRNPLSTGMRSRSLLSRLFGRGRKPAARI